MTTPVAFLLDEHVPLAVRNAVVAIEPAIRVRLIGTDPDIPPKRTNDPGLLAFAEDNGFAVVTFDKTTMPGHVADHLAAGHHTWGVFLFPNGRLLSAGEIARELVMIWAASDRSEWVDRIEFLPY
jgi:hypothetical protein